MAIYGVGSNWSGEELRERFFTDGRFILGWNEESAMDLYSFVASLKVGDILYIKSNQPGARTIRVKGVGIVTKNLLNCMSSGVALHAAISDWESLSVEVAWIHREEFHVHIPENEGKLTNIRAATIYEEYLPFVQEAIIARIIHVAAEPNEA
jgi:hypothetical protein